MTTNSTRMALGLMLVLLSCMGGGDQGYFGEWLPDYCRGDKLDALYNDVPVIRTSLHGDNPFLPVNMMTAAECVNCNQPEPQGRMILLDTRLGHAARRGALRHEKCHLETYKRTGSAKFHD